MMCFSLLSIFAPLSTKMKRAIVTENEIGEVWRKGRENRIIINTVSTRKESLSNM